MIDRDMYVCMYVCMYVGRKIYTFRYTWTKVLNYEITIDISINLKRIFHETNNPTIGVHPFMETRLVDNSGHRTEYRYIIDITPFSG